MKVSRNVCEDENISARLFGTCKAEIDHLLSHYFKYLNLQWQLYLRLPRHAWLCLHLCCRPYTLFSLYMVLIYLHCKFSDYRSIHHVIYVYTLFTILYRPCQVVNSYFFCYLEIIPGLHHLAWVTSFLFLLAYCNLPTISRFSFAVWQPTTIRVFFFFF